MSKSINALRLIILALIITVGAIGISVTAKAIETTPTEGTQNVTSEPKTITTEQKNITTNTNRITTEQKKIIVARLETTKLKVCQNRESEIKSTLARMNDRATKRVDTFDKISTRVKEFYTSKGKILDNYNQLIANVDIKKAAVEELIKNLPSASTDFICNGDNPKAIITEFKQKNQSLNAALKEYKTAIKNLIVGVKSVQGATTSETNKTTTKEQ